MTRCVGEEAGGEYGVVWKCGDLMVLLGNRSACGSWEHALAGQLKPHQPIRVSNHWL